MGEREGNLSDQLLCTYCVRTMYVICKHCVYTVHNTHVLYTYHVQNMYKICTYSVRTCATLSVILELNVTKAVEEYL